MKSRYRLAAAFCLAIALVGCFEGGVEGTGGPDKPPSIPGDRIAIVAYSVQGEKLVRTFPARIQPKCYGSDLGYDTIPSGSDTIRFSLEGDVLALYHQGVFSDFQAFTQHYTTLRRGSSGSGLPGTWHAESGGYELVSGTLTPAEKAHLDSLQGMENQRLRFYETHFLISSDSIAEFIEMNSAGLKLARWTNSIPTDELADSAQWDMDLRIVDAHTVEYHGRKTGERVQVTRSNLEDFTYRSDNPAHPEHHYRSSPTTCPNEPEPEWYLEFQRDNAKPGTVLPKTANFLKNGVYGGLLVPHL